MMMEAEVPGTQEASNMVTLGSKEKQEGVSTPVAAQKTSKATPPSHGTAVETPTGTSPDNVNVFRLPVSPDDMEVQESATEDQSPPCNRQLGAAFSPANDNDNDNNNESESPDTATPSITTPRKTLMDQMKDAIPSPESIAPRTPVGNTEIPETPEMSSPAVESMTGVSPESPEAPVLGTPTVESMVDFSPAAITEIAMDEVFSPSTASLQPSKLQFNESHASTTTPLATPTKLYPVQEAPAKQPKKNDNTSSVPVVAPKPVIDVAPKPANKLMESYPFVPTESWASVPFDCAGDNGAKYLPSTSAVDVSLDVPDDEEPLVPQIEKSVIRTLFGWIETQDPMAILPRVLNEQDIDLDEEEDVLIPTVRTKDDRLLKFAEEPPSVLSATDSSASGTTQDDEENPPHIPYTQASIARALHRKRSKEAKLSRRLCKLSFHTLAICGTIAAICVIIFMLTGDGRNPTLTNNEDSVRDIDLDLEPSDTASEEEDSKNFPNGFFSTKNEYCTGAHQIVELGVAYSGSTNSHVFDESIDSCGDSMSMGRGAWYLFEATESKLMEASTCENTDFDTQLTIATGQHCDAVDCVTFDDQGCGDQSKATWFAEAGEKYYISVHGFRGAKGDFELVVQEVTSHDSCTLAKGPLEIGSTVTGTTAGAVATDLVGQCGGMSLSNQTGVWYQVSQTEGWLRADAVARSLGFVPQVSVYRGSSCGSLTCEDGNGLGSIKWKAESTETYYIFVSGSNAETGAFDLSVSWDWQDTCEFSIPLFPGGAPVSATTEQARLHKTPACGKGGFHSAPGMWFAVMGTGSLLAATTCAPDSFLDSHISVFTNGCNALQCVGSTGVDLPCGASGAVSWISEVGVEYMVYVSGRGSRVGDFTLRIIDSVSTSGQECETPISTSPAHNTLIGSTLDAPESMIAGCGGSLEATKGTWYSFEGSGSTVSFSPCNPDTDFDVQLSVFAGSCGALQCQGAMQASCNGGSAAPMELDTVAGVQYRLLVHGSSANEVGNFAISVEEANNNDSCPTALSIDTSTNTYFGSTIASDNGPEVDCDGNPVGEHSAWYTFVGNGDMFYFNTCSENTVFSSKLTVYQGDCDSLVCVDASKEECGDQELVSIDTESGELYFVRVSGNSVDDSGDFVLQTSVRDSFFGW